MLPEEAAQHADVVMTGFAEATFPQMLLDYRDNTLKRRYVQNSDFNLEHKVIPRRDLLNPKRYITMNSIEAIRGCAHPCTFCAYPAAFGKTLYKRPVREIVAEIELLNSPGSPVPRCQSAGRPALCHRAVHRHGPFKEDLVRSGHLLHRLG